MARKTSRRSQAFKSSNDTRNGTRKGATSAVYGDVLSIVGSLFRSRQEASAEKIGSVAAAARKFAADLTDIPNVQTYVDAAADQMDSLSEYVNDNSMEQMVEDAADFAKRHPLTTAAFAVAAGFGLTRLMTNKNVFRDTKSKFGTGSTRSSSSKATTSKRRASTKVAANGRDSSHASPNVS